MRLSFESIICFALIIGLCFRYNASLVVVHSDTLVLMLVVVMYNL